MLPARISLACCDFHSPNSAVKMFLAGRWVGRQISFFCGVLLLRGFGVPWTWLAEMGQRVRTPHVFATFSQRWCTALPPVFLGVRNGPNIPHRCKQRACEIRSWEENQFPVASWQDEGEAQIWRIMTVSPLQWKGCCNPAKLVSTSWNYSWRAVECWVDLMLLLTNKQILIMPFCSVSVCLKLTIFVTQWQNT